MNPFDEVFNFAPDDELAPHYPVPIRHLDDLVGLVPGVDDRWENGELAKLAFGDFVERVEQMIQGEIDV